MAQRGHAGRLVVSYSEGEMSLEVQLANTAPGSNGGSVVDTHYEAPDNWKRQWPAIPSSVEQAKVGIFSNPKYTDVAGQEYANINYDYEAQQASNQNKPDFGDNFA
jgi:hypothetical protein